MTEEPVVLTLLNPRVTRILAVTRFLAILALAGAVTSSCRTPRRAGRIRLDSAKLVVSLIGMESTAAESNAQYPVAYQLSGCSETTNGTTQPDGKILFQSDKFFRDQLCELKVRALYESAEVRFVGEPGTLYWAKAFRIGEDARGQLVASANLQPLFERLIPRQPGRTFSLQVPVIFTPSPNDAPVTASLDCNPRIANVAEYSDPAGAPNKSFTFTVEARGDTKYACKNLWISAGGIGQKYQGRIVEGSFDGFPDANVKLSAVEIIPVPRVEGPNSQGSNSGDVDVTTSPGSCGAGEIFNTVTRTCEK